MAAGDELGGHRMRAAVGRLVGKFEFRLAEPGVRVDAAVTSLRLVDIEYDAKILRIVAEAQGTAQAAVTSLPKQ